MIRATKGRALFYHRDSGGKHEMTPGEYVEWARKEAQQRGLLFDGSAQLIEFMIQNRQSQRDDVFLDYDVKGNALTRPALDALFDRVTKDPTVSHVFIFRRDRLARPDIAQDGSLLEQRLQRAGVTVVYSQGEMKPLARGQRQKIGDAITSLVDFHQAGEDRRNLAEKIILAQLALAKSGYTTGGRPPYGFRRWFVQLDGTRVRQLSDGERIRMRGHHVVWLPVPDDQPEMITIQRILTLFRTMRATQIARLLTVERVPTPDHGRTRTDNGVTHTTSGVWHSNAITSIVRNRLLSAVCSYGRRSMGDQLRFSLDGPRELNGSDFRDSNVPKVVQNPEHAVHRHDAKFEPCISADVQKELLDICNARAGTQRGKPRSHDPNKNPLGGRGFDFDCGWLMYRTAVPGGFKYKCGLYSQSHAAECNHNSVDGPTATQFALDVMKRRLLLKGLRPKLIARLQELATAVTIPKIGSPQLSSLQTELKQVQTEVQTMKRNLALAANEQVLADISEVLEERRKQEQTVLAQIRALEVESRPVVDPDEEVRAALSVLDRIEELASDAQNYASVGAAFQAVNLRVVFKFEKRARKKRLLDVVRYAYVVFGDEPLPITPYDGPTDKGSLKELRLKRIAALSAASPGGDCPRPDGTSSGMGGNSLGNVSRGDRI